MKFIEFVNIDKIRNLSEIYMLKKHFLTQKIFLDWRGNYFPFKIKRKELKLIGKVILFKLGFFKSSSLKKK